MATEAMSVGLDWNEHFHIRARERASNVVLAACAPAGLVEAFIGPDRVSFQEREPCFEDLDVARRWARGRCDGQSWRLRSFATGELLDSSDDERQV